MHHCCLRHGLRTFFQRRAGSTGRGTPEKCSWQRADPRSQFPTPQFHRMSKSARALASASLTLLCACNSNAVASRLGARLAHQLSGQYNSAKSASRNSCLRSDASSPWKVSRPTRSRYNWSASQNPLWSDRSPRMASLHSAISAAPEYNPLLNQPGLPAGFLGSLVSRPRFRAD